MDGKVAVLLIGGAVLAAVLVAQKGIAAGQFICPVDGLTFSTQAELIIHMQTEHPGVRVPITVKWG
jgi:hypothetical protein